MPSKQTSNYNLNQWEPEDQVLRTDFNKDNEKIDKAIKAVDVRVDGKADQSALEAEINARTSAISSINTALSARGNCRVERFTVDDDGKGGGVTLKFSGKPVVFLAFTSGTLVVSHGGNNGETTGGFSVFIAVNVAVTGSCSFTWKGYQATTSKLDPNSRAGTYQVVAFYAEDGK